MTALALVTEIVFFCNSYSSLILQHCGSLVRMEFKVAPDTKGLGIIALRYD